MNSHPVDPVRNGSKDRKFLKDFSVPVYLQCKTAWKDNDEERIFHCDKLIQLVKCATRDTRNAEMKMKLECTDVSSALDRRLGRFGGDAAGRHSLFAFSATSMNDIQQHIDAFVARLPWIMMMMMMMMNDIRR